MVRVEEWDVNLAPTSSKDEDVEAFTGMLDLGIVGWGYAWLTMERLVGGDGEEAHRYTLSVHGFTVETEWHEPREHVDAALRELMDKLEELPRIDRALKRIEDLAGQRPRRADKEEAVY
jgi:hypothetical protein